MIAFGRAVELGYRHLETDVHATADGVLVAFHDADLRRTCDHAGRIDEMTWEEISTVRVSGTEPIPRLDELFEAFPDAALNIDCKSDTAAPGLIAAIKRHRALDRVCVAAFSDRRLRYLRSELGPGLLSALGPAEIAALRAIGSRAHRLISGRAAQVPVSQGRITLVEPRFISHCHELEIPVHVWTIDAPEEMHRLLDLGVDGMMTDRPEVLREVLVDRGMWHGR
jgi:glycerophosphoryl diester phosphodiesterase